MKTATIDYSQYCAYRLPCGICTRTNAPCPLNYGHIEITWASAGTSVTVNNIGTAEMKEE